MNGPYSRAYNRSSNRSYGEGGLTGAAGYGAPRRNAALAYSYGGPFGAAPTNRTNRTNWSTTGLDLPKHYGTYGRTNLSRTNLGRTNLGRTRTNVGGWGTERNATRGSNGRPASLVRPNNRRANNNKRNANRRVNNNNNWMNNNNTNRRVNNNNNNNNNRRVNNNNNNGRNTRWAYAPSPYAPSPYAAPARTNSNASASANSSWARWLRGS